MEYKTEFSFVVSKRSNCYYEKSETYYPFGGHRLFR